MSAPTNSLPVSDIGELKLEANQFAKRLTSMKAKIHPDHFEWYPYNTLASFEHLDRLLHGRNRDLRGLIRGGRVADIGCGDGDLAFFLESCGLTVDAIDHPSPNMNGMRGVAALKKALNSSVDVHNIDLDMQFVLPADAYELVFFLGILYHLKNPFYVLEMLSRQAQYCILSTAIADQLPPNAGSRDIKGVPMAYLADKEEINADSSNYWLFSSAGLRRLLKRTNWDVVEFFTAGEAGDQRAWCLARTRYALANVQLVAGWFLPESSGWRWTERCFSFACDLPLSSKTEIRMEIFVPEAYFETGKSLQLEACIDCKNVPPIVFQKPGAHVYSVQLQPKTNPTRFEFTLERSLPPSGADRRELGIIVSSVEWSVTP